MRFVPSDSFLWLKVSSMVQPGPAIGVFFRITRCLAGTASPAPVWSTRGTRGWRALLGLAWRSRPPTRAADHRPGAPEHHQEPPWYVSGHFG